jgi:hypothetical protein
MFEFYQKRHSSVLVLPVQKILQRYDSCLALNDPGSSIYGNCLIGRVLAIETVPGADSEFRNSAIRYLRWTEKIVPTLAESNLRGRFEEASKVLKKILQTDNVSS